MVEYIFDKVISVKIGISAANKATITNVLAFAERVVSVEGDMVLPISVINDQNPSGVHHSHKYLELLMVLDTDWLDDNTDPTSRWAYGPNGQPVDAATGALFAIDEDGENTAIEYFVVTYRDHAGVPIGIIYALEEENVLWCVGETSEFSNEDGVPHQTVTFKFICLQDPTWP